MIFHMNIFVVCVRIVFEIIFRYFCFNKSKIKRKKKLLKLVLVFDINDNVFLERNTFLSLPLELNTFAVRHSCLMSYMCTEWVMSKFLFHYSLHNNCPLGVMKMTD